MVSTISLDKMMPDCIVILEDLDDNAQLLLAIQLKEQAEQLGMWVQVLCLN